MGIIWQKMMTIVHKRLKIGIYIKDRFGTIIILKKSELYG